MTSRPRPVRRPMTRTTWVILGFIAVFVLLVIVGVIIGGQKGSTSGATSSSSGGSSASDVIKTLDAKIVVSSRDYQQHLADGDVQRQQSDREALLGDCDTARTIGLGQDSVSGEIRTFCAGINDPVP